MKKAFVLLFFALMLSLFSADLWAKPAEEKGPEETESGKVPAAGVITKYKEAPMLATLVGKGQLPSVDQRLPVEPAVLEPLEDTGQYGGTIRVFVTSNAPWEDLGEETERGGYLGRIDPDTFELKGNLAKGFMAGDDAKSLTIYLREGTRWSDGAPFTADDIMFMFEGFHFVYPDEVPTWNWLPQVTKVIKIDDYTVRLETDDPYRVLSYKMSEPAGGDWCAYHPKHYLQKWHIDYNPDAEKIAKEEGYDTWYDALHYHYWWNTQQDLDKPTMQPWIMTQSTSAGKFHERNPYYWKVDAEGQQLPYIDSIQSAIIDAEAYQLKIISGEADIAFAHTSMQNFTLYKENEAGGDYRVVQIPSAITFGFGVNQNQPDPFKGKLYRDVRFRQALSLAMNREEMSKVVFFGLAVPRQVTIEPTASFYKKSWGNAFVEYDPQRANRLLDEVGLDTRDKDGFRVGPEGKAVEVLIEYREGDYSIQLLELTKEYWEAVGLKTLLRGHDAALFSKRKDAVDHEIIAASRPGRELRDFLVEREDFVIGDSDFAWAPAWAAWTLADLSVKTGQAKLSDYTNSVLPGEEPPEELKELFQWGEDRVQTEPGSREYRDLSQKIFDFHAKNVIMIGTVGLLPQLLIAKNSIGNVPTQYTPGGSWWGDLNLFAEQLYIKQ